jgi:hypothetical protein
MSRDEATPQEEQLAAVLAAFDDALATGAPLPGTPGADATGLALAARDKPVTIFPAGGPV